MEEVWGRPGKASYERPQRTFGFFERYYEAFLSVKDNVGNMQEMLYDYLVLEYIEPGIHSKVISREWYRWNMDEKRWVYAECPKEFEVVTNFAVG